MGAEDHACWILLDKMGSETGDRKKMRPFVTVKLVSLIRAPAGSVVLQKVCTQSLSHRASVDLPRASDMCILFWIETF